MARLPQPGGDEGDWGSILNEYLSVSHSSDGTLKNGVVSGVALQNDSITGPKLQNQTITSSKIAASNPPSSGQVLSYNGSGFEWINVGGGGIVNWGDINGSLSNQTDLQTALNGKSNTGHIHDDRYYTETETDALLDDKQDLDADLTAIASLAASNDDIIQRKAGAWTNRTPTQLKMDLALSASDVGLSNVPNVDATDRASHSGTQTASTISDFSSAADARIAAQKGEANGVASLDSDSKVPGAQMPDSVLMQGDSRQQPAWDNTLLWVNQANDTAGNPNTGQWPDRMRFTLDGRLVQWFNEFFEWRGMPSSQSRVGWRIFAAPTETEWNNRNPNVPVIEMHDHRDVNTGRNTMFAVNKRGDIQMAGGLNGIPFRGMLGWNESPNDGPGVYLRLPEP